MSDMPDESRSAQTLGGVQSSPEKVGREQLFADTDLLALWSGFLLHDYWQIKPVDRLAGTEKIVWNFDPLVGVESRRTTNEPSIQYEVLLRKELDRQTGILEEKIEGARSVTIAALKEECNVLRNQNAQLQQQQASLQRQAAELEARLVGLSEQNSEMSEILSTKYTARNLFLGSSFVSLAMVCALALYALRGIVVVDPFLAGVVLAIGGGFMGLAALRSRQDKKKQP